MKRNIITAAVLLLVCLSNVIAQDNVKVTPSIAKNFENEFSGASKIEWTKADRVFVAKFMYEDNLWMAYFKEDGEKLASGRKIKSLDQLPILVRQGILRIKNSQERKFGSINTSYAIEMIEQNTTKYYVPMENASISLIIAADNSGSTTICKKELKQAHAKPGRDLIAKKN